MKNIFKGFLLMISAAMIFAACKKMDSLPYYAKGTVPVLSANVTSVTATAADSNKSVLTLNWSNPHYATDSSSQKFVIEIDSTGRNFTNEVTTTVSGTLSTSFTANRLDSILAGFGFAPDSSYGLDMRVKSSYANNNELYTSNTVKITIKPYVVPVMFTLSPATAQVLTISSAANTALSFNWTASKYGADTIFYALELDTAGNNFVNPQTIKFDTAHSGNITVSDLNTAILSAGIAAGAAKDIGFRILGYLNRDYAKPVVISNTQTVNITTYLPFLYLYVPGDYQGWSPGSAPSLGATVPNLNAYEGYVNVPSGGTYQFKITNAPDWNHLTYGDAGNGTLSTSGGNIVWPTGGGYYLLKADLSALTWSATLTTWGIIGDATPNGWNASTEMTYDVTNNVWVINSIPLIVGSMKFRANDAWDINLGGDINALTYNGGNISVNTSGNYKITLDLSHPLKYTATITKL